MESNESSAPKDSHGTIGQEQVQQYCATRGCHNLFRLPCSSLSYPNWGRRRVIRKVHNFWRMMSTPVGS